MNAIVWNMKEQIITGRHSSPEHRLRTDAGIVIKNYRRIKLLLTTSSRSQKHRKKHPPGKRCGSVNDIRNLAPACRDCNSKKSDKMGLWVVRGWLGKYKLYWIILRIIQIVCILLMICGGFYLAKKIMLFV